MGAHLDRQTACHFAHGGQEGKAAVGGLHRLIGDGGDLLLQKSLSLSGIGGEMQVRKEGLPFPQEAVLRLQRLFHLDDHIGSIKNGFGVGEDLSAHGGILGIGKAAAQTGALLHVNGVSGADKRVYTCWGQADAAFLRFDFFGTTNAHGKDSFQCFRTAACGPESYFCIIAYLCRFFNPFSRNFTKLSWGDL